MPKMPFYCQVSIADTIGTAITVLNSYTVLELLPDLGGNTFATRNFSLASVVVQFAPLVTLTAPLTAQLYLPMNLNNGINAAVTADFFPASDTVWLSPTTAVILKAKIDRRSKDYIWNLSSSTETLLQIRYVNPFGVSISPAGIIKTTVTLLPDYADGTV
jgi:hypothetical protein